jgi:hypothetical protein
MSAELSNVDPQKRVCLSVFMDRQLRDRLDLAAKMTDLSRSAFTRQVLRKQLSKLHPRQEPLPTTETVMR